MKTLFKIVVFLLITAISVQAQTPFKGFFKPLKSIEKPKTLKATLGSVTVGASSQWMFRPTAQVSILKLQYVGGENGWLESAFKAAGVGLSYQKISVVDGSNYCNLAFNALLNFNYDIQGVEPVKLGGFADVAVFNNLIGLGIGWDAGQKYPYLGFNASWEF